MSSTDTSPTIVLSPANHEKLAPLFQEYEVFKKFDLSDMVNLLLPFGISRYKALAKDAQKRGSTPPGERKPREARAPRTAKAAPTRDAVSELINDGSTATPKRGAKSAEEREAEKIAAKAKKDAERERIAAAAKEKLDAEIAKKAEAKAAKDAAKAAKPNGKQMEISEAAPAKKGGAKKKQTPTSTGLVWWIVKFGKQEVQVSARDKEQAISEALEQLPKMKKSQVTAVFEEEGD